jgi:hypothetical protein
MLIFSQAIKEAQKTLDKALDIQEGDEPAQDKQGKALLYARRHGPMQHKILLVYSTGMSCA